ALPSDLCWCSPAAHVRTVGVVRARSDARYSSRVETYYTARTGERWEPGARATSDVAATVAGEGMEPGRGRPSSTCGGGRMGTSKSRSATDGLQVRLRPTGRERDDTSMSNATVT